MAYYQHENDKQYLDPVTGQYYTMQMYNPPSSGSFWGSSYNYGNPFAGYSARRDPVYMRKNTGDVSVINKMLKNKQPYQYNAPSIASMFPLMNMPTMGNLQSPQYTGGAGQFLGGNFLGGLLGNASAAPAAAADASSGAGRYA